MELPELQVFAALKEGNESAFEMLFRTYYKPLCNYAYSFLNDKDEAEEVVQSAFIGVWDKRTSIEIQTSMKSYLYRMVRNSCLNVIKHSRVKMQHARHEMAGGEPVYENASQAVISNELEQKIREAMKELPEQCRLVFQLSRFEELKYSEIAGQLNISVKTVENHMGKALKIMREQLKDYLPLFLIFMKDWII
ncbi:MAG TPA: RNA polymerase sigma-70 factor [Cyclobacteriaceae bacterium]|nr:RNA polymerase sigma-70 factor [Cyclobacteriaceae bacterium]